MDINLRSISALRMLDDYYEEYHKDMMLSSSSREHGAADACYYDYDAVHRYYHYNSNGSSHTSHQHGTTAHQNQIKASNSKSSSIPHDWVTYVDTLYQEEERRRQKQMERQQSA